MASSHRSRSHTTWLRRFFRRPLRQAKRAGTQAEQHLEQNFFSRLSRLMQVRRFAVGWIALVVLLAGCVVVQLRSLGGYYRTLQPAPGGIYSEGIVGNFTNANPLYVTGQVNDAVSKLLFAGLFKYDNKNKLVGDLAERMEVDDAATTYTVHLRPGLTWHDGQRLTAQDVVYTYKTIQNPDAKSPLNSSFKDVGVKATDEHTVVFTLPNPLSSFPYSLTNGIVPEHVLRTVAPDDLRSAAFNVRAPVGAGPFRLKTIEVKGTTPNTREEEVALQPFDGYHAGRPKLSSFVVHTFPSEAKMLEAFKDQSLSAMVGLNSLPNELAADDSVRSYNMPLDAATMVFFRTSEGVLQDPAVRRALVGGTDTAKVLSQLGYQARPVREPLLQGQTGYDPAYQQMRTSDQEAEQTLLKAGWKPRADGYRYNKAGKQLAFSFYAQNTPEYTRIAGTLQQQWKRLGVNVRVYLQPAPDLHSTVAYHSYDAVLYGISIGVDPDVFVYWHSSQADVCSASCLNLSEYKSKVADAALDAGRTRGQASLRAIKYAPFLRAWQKDAPALGLYQPRFLYVTRGQVYNLADHSLTIDTDRFNNVQDWMIRQAPQQIKR